MANKLKNLKVTKVDFVDEGANPDAHTMIKKRKAEQQTEPNSIEKEPGVIKRLLSFIGKAAGIQQSEIDTAVEEITKGNSMSFAEKLSIVENSKIADEIWDTCYALQSSLCSILNDEDLDSTGRAAAMQKSVDEFQSVMVECVSKWSSGTLASIAKEKVEVTEADLDVMKSAISRLNANIEKAAGTNAVVPAIIELKGEEKEMRVDKSKMTDAERAFYESIEKKYGVEDGAPAEGADSEVQKSKETQEESVMKATMQAQENLSGTGLDGGEENVYKNLHPAVRAEIEALKKFKEDVEDRELMSVAKRYEIIGKKPEELVPTLKSLKAAGGTAYNDMIALLDQTVETVEKSGVFSEIGKAGHGETDNAAEVKIDKIAKGYMEADPGLSYTSAIAKAWEENPELMAEYDEQAGF